MAEPEKPWGKTTGAVVFAAELDGHQITLTQQDIDILSHPDALTLYGNAITFRKVETGQRAGETMIDATFGKRRYVKMQSPE